MGKPQVMTQFVEDHCPEPVEENVFIGRLQSECADDRCFTGTETESEYSPNFIFIMGLFYVAGVVPDGGIDVLRSQANDDGAGVG